MRNLFLLIILVAFTSCNPKSNFAQSHSSYEQGMLALHKLDSTGEQDYKTALLEFNEAVNQDSKHIQSRYWKSYCELRLGKLDDALKTSVLAINILNKSNSELLPYFLITAGLIEKVNNNFINSNEYFEKAKSIYENRLKSNKNDVDAIMNNATILCYMGKKDVAIEFVNSISVDEKNHALLLQIRDQIEDFDKEEILQKIKNNVW